MPLNPQVFIYPHWFSQKDIADPLWFYHKSSSRGVYMWGVYVVGEFASEEWEVFRWWVYMWGVYVDGESTYEEFL